MSVKRTVRRSPRQRAAPARKSKTDWKRLAKMSNAEIAAAHAADKDTFLPDAAWWRRARVVMPASKKLVSLRLDADVLDWFQKQGRGYQTKLNAVLRSYVAAQADC